MAPHSSTLAWKIPWTEEPGRLQSMGSLGVRHDWATSLSLSCIGEGNGNPLQYSCLENPRDGGAWWATVSGVAQSRTWLKQLSRYRKALDLTDTISFISKRITHRQVFYCSWPHSFIKYNIFMANMNDSNSCIQNLRRRQWHPTPVLLPGKSHGRRSLVGCSPWGR